MSKETAQAWPRRRDAFLLLGEEEQPVASLLPSQFPPGGRWVFYDGSGFWTMEMDFGRWKWILYNGNGFCTMETGFCTMEMNYFAADKPSESRGVVGFL